MDTEATMTLRQAAARGIPRVRMARWANPLDHFRLDILPDPAIPAPGGALGPWIHLHSPSNVAVNGRDPVDIFWAFGSLRINPDAPGFVAYDGPLPGSEDHEAAASTIVSAMPDTDDGVRCRGRVPVHPASFRDHE